nr:inorganic phosphate transporter [Chloroflexota bacterium]
MVDIFPLKPCQSPMQIPVPSVRLPRCAAYASNIGDKEKALTIYPAVVLVVAALIFGFLNGVQDAGNVVATAISSRSMNWRQALVLNAIAHFCGPFLFGVAVATTIGQGLVAPNTWTAPVILAALLAAILWSLITWFFGIPSSSSHGLIGGILGAVSVDFGLGGIQMHGLMKVMIALFLSPILGLVVGRQLMQLILFLAREASPGINQVFKRLQTFTTLILALTHGANDAQKTMGIIAGSLVACGYQSEFSVARWVVAVSAGAMALGSMFGGWRVIKTVGSKFYKIRPVHSCAAQLSSAMVILGAALLGVPVSTTQVVNSATVGVGSAGRLSRVRWKIVRGILLTWVLTIPATTLLAALIYRLISRLLRAW